MTTLTATKDIAQKDEKRKGKPAMVASKFGSAERVPHSCG